MTDSSHDRSPRLRPLTPSETTEEQAEVVDRIRASGVDADNLFLTLARQPRLLRRWAAFGGTLLTRGQLGDRELEILILRTAWRCRADYPWGEHVRRARRLGLDDDLAPTVARADAAEHLDEVGAALIRTADELHATSTISDDTWRALAAHFSPEQLVEIVMVVGQYHLVSYCANGFRIECEEGLPGVPDD